VESENQDFQELDSYEIALIEATDRLKACQNEYNLKSCLECDKVIGCEVRNSYVKAVYESMNKGKGGGFEF
jgi:hypothetical protein